MEGRWEGKVVKEMRKIEGRRVEEERGEGEDS